MIITPLRTRWIAIWTALVALDLALIAFGSDFWTTVGLVSSMFIVPLRALSSRDPNHPSLATSRAIPDFLAAPRPVSDDPLWDRHLDG
jgi:hypothetical protein